MIKQGVMAQPATADASKQLARPSLSMPFLEQVSASVKQIHLLLDGYQAAWALDELLQLFVPELTQTHVHLALRPGWQGAEKRAQEATQKLHDYQTVLDLHGYEASSSQLMTRDDFGINTLLSQLSTEQADLLVIVEGENTDLSAFHLELANRCPCSVLLLKKPLNHSPRSTIQALLAIDGELGCFKAAAQLPHLLNMRSLAVSLVQVQNPAYLQDPQLASFMNLQAMDTYQQQKANETFSAIEQLLGRADGAISIAHRRRLVGEPHWELLRFSQQLGSELLVLGSNTQHYGTNWRLGSVATRLVLSSDASLLLLR